MISQTDHEIQISKSSRPWREMFLGGTPESEEAIFRRLAQQMVEVQKTNQLKGNGAAPDRTLHAKGVVCVTNALFEVNSDLPEFLTIGYFQPGTKHSLAVRLSNASGTRRPDGAPDMRGAALRIALPKSQRHDLLMTSYPVSHARDAIQFVKFAKIAAGPKLLMLPRLVLAFGVSDCLRILKNIKKGVRISESLAAETYWSRGAVLWGTAGPCRFRLRPFAHSKTCTTLRHDDPNYLFGEFAERLLRDEVKFEFCLQPYVDEERTPIENAAVEWKDQDSPPIPIAVISIPRQDLKSDSARQAHREVEKLAFNPWNAPEDFRPLGNINRARKTVYAASAARWVKSI